MNKLTEDRRQQVIRGLVEFDRDATYSPNALQSRLCAMRNAIQ
jgi:hypothetical protein